MAKTQHSAYLAALRRLILKLKHDKAVATPAELERLVKAARASAGGTARAEHAKEAALDAAIDRALLRLDEDDDEDMLDADDLAELLELEGSFEDGIGDVRDALCARYGTALSVIATYDDHVVYCVYANDGMGEPTYYSQAYSDSEAGTDNDITLGPRIEVTMATQFKPVKAEDDERELAGVSLVDPLGSDETIALVYAKAGASGSLNGGKTKLPANVAKLPAAKQKQFVDVWNRSYKACSAKGGSNCEAVAFRFANGVLKGEGFGAKKAVKASDLGWSSDDDDDSMYTLAELRLGDDISPWQQIHKVGEWAVEHGTGGKIVLTREMGDSMIRNFKRGVVRKPVTLDERHQTEQDGHALAQLADMRWGSENDGLPGYPEPDGVGPILYAKWSYNDLGQYKLSNRHYSNQSPQYSLDYVDKESGRHYGPTLIACAATNNPFTRLRTWQGEPAPEPVLLSDGRRRPQGETGMPPEFNLSEYEANMKRLAELEKRDADNAKKLADAEKREHGNEVKRLTDRAIRRGVPPAAAKIVRNVMLANRPSDDAPREIRLSDDEAAAGVSVMDAMAALLDEIAVMPDIEPTGERRTLADDFRLPNDGTKRLDDAIEAARKEARGFIGSYDGATDD